MRDPRRIPIILLKLGRYWNSYPDLRLGQILGNFEIGYNTEDSVLMDTLERLDNVEPMEFLEPQESMAMVDTMESFDQKVERIAKAWFESPGPDGDLEPDWDTAHPEDKDTARYNARFILTEAGIE